MQVSEIDGHDSGNDHPIPRALVDSPESGGGTLVREDDETTKAFKSIGYGRRWYDPLYNLSRFLQYSWLGRRLPASGRRRFYYLSNYLIQLHEVKLLAAMKNCP